MKYLIFVLIVFIFLSFTNNIERRKQFMGYGVVVAETKTEIRQYNILRYIFSYSHKEAFDLFSKELKEKEKFYGGKIQDNDTFFCTVTEDNTLFQPLK